MKMAMKTTLSAVVLAATLGFGTAAGAFDLPCRNVKFIASTPPGGPTDIQSRLVAEAANRLGAKPQLQVVNIKGQGGVEGGRVLRDAPPDGCTLLYTHWNHILLYLTGRFEVNYDSFTPIALMTKEWRMIGASKEAPFNTLAEMVAYAKKNGPESVIAGTTLGATSHFELLMLEDEANFKFKIVSYNAARERVTALLANNIQVSDMGNLEAAGYVKKGQLKALGILAPRRTPVLPDVTTSKENGLKTQFSLSHGVWAPKGMSKEVVDYYVDIFRKVSEDEKFKKALAAKDVDVTFMPPAEYTKYMEENYLYFTKLAKAVGVYKVK